MHPLGIFSSTHSVNLVLLFSNRLREERGTDVLTPVVMVPIEEDAEVDNLELERQRMGKVEAEVAFRPEASAENAEPRSSHPYATETAGKAGTLQQPHF